MFQAIVIVLDQVGLYKLFALAPAFDQCQSGRPYLAECNYIALLAIALPPPRQQPSQPVHTTRLLRGRCTVLHTFVHALIFDTTQAWTDVAGGGETWQNRVGRADLQCNAGARPKH